jgi:hypothetical protein
MDQHTLQIFLPAFMVVFFGTLSLWSHLRKNKSIRLLAADRKKIQPELLLVDAFFKVLLVLAMMIALMYAFFPEYYFVAGPIPLLDNPVVNLIGVLVLTTSLFWMVMAQFNIERTIALINSGVKELRFDQLLSYSQKLLLTGMLIMFIGLFITISSVLAIIICVTAIFLFNRLSMFNRKNNSHG